MLGWKRPIYIFKWVAHLELKNHKMSEPQAKSKLNMKKHECKWIDLEQYHKNLNQVQIELERAFGEQA